MLILVHTAHPQAESHAGDGFGRLLSPRQYARVRDTAAAGIPWAADNDCYQGLDVKAYLRMLASIKSVPRCLFVTVPDVVADWQATRDLFGQWWVRCASTGQPLAYVVQGGQPADRIPWEAIGCVFIGGSTLYKLSAEAERIAREARGRGLWVHMGRVNSRTRFDYARAIGCDSVDGSQFSRWRNTWLPDALTWHRDHLQQRIPA